MRLVAWLARWILNLSLADVDLTISATVKAHVGGPILFVANHVASTDSWCALVISVLGLNRRLILFAHERVLTFFPVLGLIGLLPVSAANPGAAFAAMKKAVMRAREEAELAIWIFPQATHFHSSLQIENFTKGVYVLMRLLPSETIVVPVGIHYFVYRQPRAAVAVSVGDPVGTTRDIGSMPWPDAATLLQNSVQREVDTAQNRAIGYARKRIRYPFQPKD